MSADVANAARRRLAQLDQAASVDDMRSPPRNRLDMVNGNVWSICINMQYRITLICDSNGPEDVWMGDYH
jgi:proteic killer suppression protein